MAEFKTYGGFRDWAFGILLGGNIAMQWSINATVNKLDKNDAVTTALYKELEKNHMELKSEVSAMRKEQEETDKEVARIQEYLKPNETREQKKITNR